MVLLFFLPVLGVALGLFLLVLAWSGYSLSQASRIGGSAAVIAHILLGSVVLVLSFDIYGPYFFNWSCSKGFIVNCYPEASLIIILMGLLPCGFPITGHILRLVWRSKR
jgi:hypothetical protein